MAAITAGEQWTSGRIWFCIESRHPVLTWIPCASQRLVPHHLNIKFSLVDIDLWCSICTSHSRSGIVPGNMQSWWYSACVRSYFPVLRHSSLGFLFTSWVGWCVVTWHSQGWYTSPGKSGWLSNFSSASGCLFGSHHLQHITYLLPMSFTLPLPNTMPQLYTYCKCSFCLQDSLYSWVFNLLHHPFPCPPKA